MGNTLNALLAYLQFYRMTPSKADIDSGLDISSKVDFSKWVEY